MKKENMINLDDILLSDPNPTETHPNRPVRAYQKLKSFIYHTTNLMRITFVLQTLTGRSLNQLFSIKSYEFVPTKEVQNYWLGLPLTATSFVAAIIIQRLNSNNSQKYPAIEDIAFTLFSSASLWIVADNLVSASKMNNMPPWIFWTATGAIPLCSFIAARGVITNTSRELVYKRNQFNDKKRFPAFPEASKIEDAFNALHAFTLIAGPNALFWVVSRERNGKTVPMDSVHMAVIGAYCLSMLYVSTHITSEPKMFHAALAFSKGCNDAAFAYAALSGIAFHLLILTNQCNQSMCWNESQTTILMYVFIAIALLVGVTSALRTSFDYQGNHQKTLDFFEAINNFKQKLSGCKNKILSCCSYFKKSDEGTLLLSRDDQSAQEGAAAQNYLLQGSEAL